MKNDLPAIYHEHGGPTDHRHEGMGPGHYSGDHGHFHLTAIYTADEIAEMLEVPVRREAWSEPVQNMDSRNVSDPPDILEP